MAVPQNREAFAQFVLRKLGAPVINIELSEEQLDDCIDQALYYYQEYHMEGADVYYYSYSVNNADIANQYITLPEGIIGVTDMFPIGDALNTNSLFNMKYQFVINDLYNISNVSLIPYYMVMSHVQFLEEMLVGRQPLRYNRHKNICYIDMDWSQITEGEYLLIKCYQAIDPAAFPGVYSDKFLQEYTTALAKIQWGSNLKKFNMMLPGQQRFSGQTIYNEGVEEKRKLEYDMVHTWSLPAEMLIG